MTQTSPPAARTLCAAPLPRVWPYVPRFCGSLVVLLTLTCCCPQSTCGQAAGVIDREYPLKAAYLYNFGTYIEWPEFAFADPTASLVIGILGHDSFGTELDQLARRKIGNRPVEIRHLSDPSGAVECHILFVAASVSGPQLQETFAKVRGLPVLCVGESPGFSKAGGEIGFFVQENKLRFEINIHAARQQGLKISSKLLGVATVVGSEHVLTNSSSRVAH